MVNNLTHSECIYLLSLLSARRRTLDEFIDNLGGERTAPEQKEIDRIDQLESKLKQAAVEAIKSEK